MRIDPKEQMYGVPALQVRDAIRNIPGGGISAIAWQRALRKLPQRKAKEVYEGLLRDGYIEPWISNEAHLSCCVSRTEKGNRLAQASARSLKRSRADRMVQELLERAGAINANDEYCYRVGVLVLFGSYLDATKEEIGDLDVAYAYEDRYSREGMAEARGPMHLAQEASRERARQAGKSFSTYLEHICWPQREVVGALKAKAQGLSLHVLESGERKMVLGGLHRVIFGRVPEEANEANVYIGEDP